MRNDGELRLIETTDRFGRSKWRHEMWFKTPLDKLIKKGKATFTIKEIHEVEVADDNKVE